jgi:hypothetical protein
MSRASIWNYNYFSKKSSNIYESTGDLFRMMMMMMMMMMMIIEEEGKMFTLGQTVKA